MRFLNIICLLLFIYSCSSEETNSLDVKFIENLKGKSFEYVYRTTKKAYHFPTEGDFFMLYIREFDQPLFRDQNNQECTNLTYYEIRNTSNEDITFEYRLCNDSENSYFTIKALDTINLCAVYLSNVNGLVYNNKGRCESLTQRDCTKFSYNNKETYYNENILDLGLMDPKGMYLDADSKFEILKDTETQLFYKIQGMQSTVRIELTYDKDNGTITKNVIRPTDGNIYNEINPTIYNFTFTPAYIEACD